MTSRHIDTKSWLRSKYGLSTFLLVSILCLYSLIFFYMDSSLENIRMFKTITMDNWFHQVPVPVEIKTKKILFWNTMFGHKNFYFGDGEIFLGCAVPNCYATHDRTYTDIADFDALLFHGNEILESDVPTRRASGQWYVFVSLESPENRPLPRYISEDYFNLTMTYRLDSDVPWTYGVVQDLESGRVVAPLWNTTWRSFSANFTENEGAADVEEEKIEEKIESSLARVIESKTRLVSWFVSNCLDKSGRLAYAKELSKHVSVDIYGKCGDKYCARDRDCFGEVVEPNYFFYLSFENSLCQDYVTEKLYNALRYNVVPVVYGGANYTIFAPPKSYINALDFDTPKDLATYLTYLAKNPLEYSKYFRWKKYYKIGSYIRRTICKLCELLHEKKDTRIYDPLSEWYSKDKCPIQRLLRHQKYATRATLNNPNL